MFSSIMPSVSASLKWKGTNGSKASNVFSRVSSPDLITIPSTFDSTLLLQDIKEESNRNANADTAFVFILKQI